MAPSAQFPCLARDRSEEEGSRNRREGRFAWRPGLPSRDGQATQIPGCRCSLSRWCAREQSAADRAGRRRSHRLLPHPPTGRAPLRLANAHPLPARKPLPPGRRDPLTEPLRRHAGLERSLCAGLQPTARPPRSCLRPPLLVQADRVGGAVHQHARLRPQQSPPPRLGPAVRGMALDFVTGYPSDRFDSSRTTPTS
jgi:hypothetical protein